MEKKNFPGLEHLLEVNTDLHAQGLPVLGHHGGSSSSTASLSVFLQMPQTLPEAPGKNKGKKSMKSPRSEVSRGVLQLFQTSWRKSMSLVWKGGWWKQTDHLQITAE